MIYKKQEKLDVFSANYLITVADSIEEFVNEYKNFEKMRNAAAFTYSTIGNDNTRYFGVVITPENDDQHLVHESVHLASSMLRSIGLDHLESTEEAYAYTASYIYTRLKEAKQLFLKRKEKKYGRQ